MRLGRVLVDEPDNRRAARIARINDFQFRTVAFLPVGERRAQQGDHLGLLEIACHSQNDTVGMNGSLVKRDEIVSRNSLDRFYGAFTSAGMLRPIELLEEFPANNRPRAVLTTADTLDVWSLASSTRGASNAGWRKSPAKILSPRLRSLLRTSREADPDCRPIAMLISIANCSSSSSICSAVLPPPPPVRMTAPVNAASPTLSAGSSHPPVRIIADKLTSGSSWSSSR